MSASDQGFASIAAVLPASSDNAMELCFADDVICMVAYTRAIFDGDMYI